MTPAYVAELGLTTQKTSIGAQKIDGLPLETYNMALTRFSVQDSLGRVRLFEKIFLLANTSIEVVLEMPFLSLNNANIEFTKLEKLIWKTYIVGEALPTTNWVKLIDKKEFARAALNENSEIFMVHIAALEVPTVMSTHFSKTFQVQRSNEPTLAVLQ